MATPPQRIFEADIPDGMYLGRYKNVNPTVFLQWGQELAETLRLNNFTYYGEFEISDKKTIFMRNLRLTLTPDLYSVRWFEPYKISYKAYNSHTGRTSFDMTIEFYVNKVLIAKLIRKMVYVNLETNKPTELPPKFVEMNPYKNLIHFNLENSRPWGCSAVPLTVRPSDIDYHQHVGHPVYVNYALDASHLAWYKHFSPPDLLHRDQKIFQIDLEYKLPAVLGKDLTVYTWDTPVDVSSDILPQDKSFDVHFVMYQNSYWFLKNVVCLAKVTINR